MAYYLRAFKDAADKFKSGQLVLVLNFLLELAVEEYKGGKLTVIEYGDIINAYAATLQKADVRNYI